MKSIIINELRVMGGEKKILKNCVVCLMFRANKHKLSWKLFKASVNFILDLLRCCNNFSLTLAYKREREKY